MEASDVHRLRHLEAEHNKLKRMQPDGRSGLAAFNDLLHPVTGSTGSIAKVNTFQIVIKCCCIHCYARPSHGYLNLSAGLDFETKLFAKTNLEEVLRGELSKRSYVCKPINIGSNTDPYQPIENKWRLTRAALALLNECNHPCTIVTKNAMIERDLDILVAMAERNPVHVFISINSLDNKLASKLEPRASAPHRRMKAVGP